MKKFLFLFALLGFALTGCQSEKTTGMPGSNQVDDIKGVQISKFEGLGSLNENFKQKFSKDKELKAFKKVIKHAKKQDKTVDKYDYDMELVFSDGGDKGLHITKNNKDEIILKYIGDSTDTYISSSEYSKDLIKLIY
ncbi:hypothetical protein MOF34_18325 [Bacillus sp. T17B1]|uniref:hypothetical protein n=1 Tax=Bacillus sp. T17B1 TaxID=2918911 RepID=UPI00227E248E|nr:hypothetical protein [Bacillus sp. T17B1]